VSRGFSAASRLLALLGDPVAHSLSPAFQNAALRERGLDAVYLALRCDAPTFPSLLRGIAGAGGAGNITVPHKELAAGTVDRLLPAAQRTGACNAFWAESGVIWGDNTDVVGVTHALRDLVAGELVGARVLVLGAGGAARAALCALVDGEAGAVTLLNRTESRAAALRDRFADAANRIRLQGSIDRLRGERFDIVVNATSLGLRHEDPLPLDPGSGVEFGAALDLVYAPERTRWVRSLLADGVHAEDGLGMLIHQGAAAFERWWGITAPLDVMRAALPPRDHRVPDDAAPPAA